MYAKLENGYLRSAPKTVQWQGHTVNNPSADKLAELGYKPVVYTDMPAEAVEGKHWESGWTEEANAIKQVWKLVEDPVYSTPEPTPEERISNLETTTDELKSTSDDIILMMADIIGGQE